MSETMTKCPNPDCEYDFGYVPKWEPGDKCPQCGYAPPKWLYLLMVIICIGGIGLGFLISKTFFGNSRIGNWAFSIIGLILAPIIMVKSMELLKRKFGWFKNIY